MNQLDLESIDIYSTLRESASLEDKIKKLTSVLLTLHAHYEVLKHFNSAAELEEFVLQGLNVANKILDIDNIVLLLKENDRFSVVSEFSANSTIPYDKKLLIWKIFEGRKAVVVKNITPQKIKSIYGSGLKKTNASSILFLPLFSKKKEPIGLINIHSKDHKAFGNVCLSFYKDLAQEVAKTLTRAKEFSLLKELSFVDELTGLYNRRFLFAILEKEIIRAERYEAPFSFVIADLNNFKKINDTYGHPKGDMVLRTVADSIRVRLRKSDIAVRYGGDEFAIVLPETSLENTKRVMESINKNLKSIQFPFREKVSLAYGIASFPNHADEIDSLVLKADIELYNHKKKFKHR